MEEKKLAKGEEKLLAEIVGCPLEDWPIIKDRIPKNNANYTFILTELFGPNLDQKLNLKVYERLDSYDQAAYHRGLKIIEKIMMNYQKEQTIERPLLTTLVNCSAADVANYMQLFAPQSNEVMLMQKLFGPDYTANRDAHTFIMLTRVEMRIYQRVIDVLTEASNFKCQYLFELIHCLLHIQLILYFQICY